MSYMGVYNGSLPGSFTCYLNFFNDRFTSTNVTDLITMKNLVPRTLSSINECPARN